ncbi:STAS domain-containing protein [Sessilibacter sp. MAH4]
MSEKTSFSCGEHLDITQVASLHARLSKAIAKASVIELKADKVVKADTAGLQLFVSLQKEISGNGGKIIWRSPSDALINAAKLLGLSKVLDIN